MKFSAIEQAQLTEDLCRTGASTRARQRGQSAEREAAPDKEMETDAKGRRGSSPWITSLEPW
jgi:hypothetical protein